MPTDQQRSKRYWQRVSDASGTVIEPFHGWSAYDVFDFGGELRYVALKHKPSYRAGWFVDRDGVFLSDAKVVTEFPEQFAGRILGKQAQDDIISVLSNPTRWSETLEKLVRLQSNDELALEAVLKSFDVFELSQSLDIRGAQDSVLLLSGNEVVHINRHGALAALEHYGWDFETVIQNDALRLPSAFPDDRSEAIRHIPLTLSQEKAPPFYLGIENGKAYFRIGMMPPIAPGSEQGIVYLPEQGLIFHGAVESEQVRRDLRRAFVPYITILLKLNDQKRTLLLEPPKKFGILLAGRDGGRHFGHAIIDEMQAIDRLLDTRPGGDTLPLVYYSSTQGGSDLYGPLEELYPELEGRTFRVESPSDLLKKSLADGSQVIHVNGRTALHATRRRIMAAVEREAERLGLNVALNDLIGSETSRRPVIGLGLRLTNRCLVDLLSFYARLTKELCDRLGPITIVIDGINGSGQGDEAATVIYSAGAIIGQKMSTGGVEIKAELSFVKELKEAISDLPVKVVSCVAKPIHENLFWLSQCNFTISPLGAGLAKSRWALDIPGYVLISATNLNWCNAYDIYSSKYWMERPYTTLYYNKDSDVFDLLSGAPPDGKSFIPWPNNFEFRDEAKIISNIADLAVKHVATRTSHYPEGATRSDKFIDVVD